MPQEQKLRETLLLRTVLFTFFVSGAAAQLGSLMPFLRQAHGLSYDFSGFLISCQSTGYLISILLAGLLPAYLGRRKTVLFTSVWMAAAYLIFTGGLGHPAALLAACLMVGFARGGNTNFANTMVSTLSGERSTQGFNFLHGAFAMGALLTPMLLVYAGGRWPRQGWRLVSGVLLALVTVQIAVYGRMALPPEKPAGGVGQVDMSFLKVRTFWLSAAMLFFYISTEFAISGWLVTYFQDIGVLSAAHAQLMNSLFWVVMFVGRMLGAVITGKVSRNTLLIVDGVGLCVFFLILFFSRTAAVIIPSLIGVAFFMATIYPTAFAFGSDCIRGSDLGCSIIMFTGTFGGILTPALVGVVAEQRGIAAGMAVVAAATVLLLCSILLSVFSVQRAGQG